MDKPNLIIMALFLFCFSFVSSSSIRIIDTIIVILIITVQQKSLTEITEHVAIHCGMCFDEQKTPSF